MYDGKSRNIQTIQLPVKLPMPHCVGIAVSWNCCQLELLSAGTVASCQLPRTQFPIGLFSTTGTTPPSAIIMSISSTPLAQHPQQCTPWSFDAGHGWSNSTKDESICNSSAKASPFVILPWSRITDILEGGPAWFHMWKNKGISLSQIIV